MDSNDRDIMTKYIENLKSDQKDIRISFSKQQTVIKEMVSKYTETFETIEQNHNNIIKRINDFLSGETVFSNEISELLFLNIISDEIGIQLEILLDVVSNLEIALSFGKTHYLHNSVIPKDKILIILEELKTMYNSSSIANFSHTGSTHDFNEDTNKWCFCQKFQSETPPQQCYAPTGRNNGVKANNGKHSGGLKSRSCVTSRSRMRPRSIGLAISTSRHTTKCRQDSD
ncbi:hypothetical protein ABEB36_000009 [Hypothenemus hampei]|uniref:Uncharacterized protein n=1 Tax=Hypothenemus hampei TaxID=57062 RepID=A0ABD1F9Z6_HYPHA